MRIRKISLLLCLFTLSGTIDAQYLVKVDPTIQRFIGEVSELDREKYFNIHATWSESDITDDEYNHYTQELNGGYGRGFWGPFSVSQQKFGSVGIYPNETEAQNWGSGSIDYNSSRSTWARRSNRIIVTEHPGNVVRWSIDTAAAAKWAANYFKYYFTDEDRPEYFEVMNEPFVHAGDDAFSAEQADEEKMRQRMAQWYAAIGRRFDGTPGLENVKVIGYSSAWPSMELWDFDHWNTRQKMFMDTAGQYMDAFAIHLYDGINVTGADSRRSGSNSEAILDLVETYSNIKWGEVKPFAISEYGGIEKGFGDDYSDLRSVQSIRSINHLIFNLLEREDRLDISIPFIGSKGLWHITEANNYQPYGSVMWRPKVVGVPVDENTEWVYTPKVYFFELWKNVRGKRVNYYSNNQDIQVQAFVDGSTVFIALNNLDEEDISFDMDIRSIGDNITEVVKKSLKIWSDQDPEYMEESLSSIPQEITLIPSEMMILECKTNSTIQFVNQISSRRYYSLNHLQKIQGMTTAFIFNDVDLGTKKGRASLRMSIARDHDQSKTPTITFNGTELAIPENWAGGEQLSRDNFFGMIEVPVPIELLNTVSAANIRFPDNGGRVSSVVLQVELLDKDTQVERLGKYPGDMRIYPNPTNGMVTIDGLQTATAYDLYNFEGQSVKSGILAPGATLKITELTSGIYFMRIGAQYRKLIKY